jgi:ketosteroid isomerase-like protein
MNVYNFKNPKIIQMTLDALSMEETAGASMTLQLAYDTVYIETGVPASGTINQHEVYDGLELKNTLVGMPTNHNQHVADSVTTGSQEVVNSAPASAPDIFGFSNTPLSSTIPTLTNTTITGVTAIDITPGSLSKVTNSLLPKF